ncbi:MAG: FtsX-like permease family protein [Bacteroidetes bacterium]|jgi:putative ABC transport system permease protein|nr:FtsX-like permease family protein [Bacteroidota bacterium]
MLRSYLTIALRTLWKHKTTSAINVTGLALGGAVVVLIALFVHHERSYDTFHEKADRLVQVVHVSQSEDRTSRTAMIPAPLPDVLRERAPGVERMTALKPGTVVAQQGGQSFEAKALYAEPAFFEMFSFPLVHGSPAEALRAPDGVVLTTEQARRLFGRTDVLGETLQLRLDQSFEPFTVTGVAAPAPSTSSLPLSIVLPYERLRDFDRTMQNPSWRTLSPLLYAQLSRPGQTAGLERALAQIRTNEMPDAKQDRLDLLPITETHLSTGIYGQLRPTSDPLYSTILIALAAFILGLAVINFTTLALARSADRGREVGMRKTLGARRSQVAAQFGGEALLATGVSLVLSVGLALLMLPAFEQLVGRSLDASVLASGPALLAALGGWLAIGLAAGSYPALVLSGFQPLTALRERAGLRHQPRLVAGLVVIQFVLAMGLVAGTFVMWQQFELLQEKDLGFQRAHVVQIDGTLLPPPATDRLRSRLHQAAQSSAALQETTGAWSTFAVEASLPNQLEVQGDGQTIQSHAYRVAPGFVETFALELLAGRSFSRDRSDDTQSVIVNRSFVETMGWDEPLGKTISVQFTVQEARVIGVVDDFHFQSLRQPIRPLVLHVAPIAPTSQLFARIAPGQTPAALEMLRGAWNEMAPDLPFQFTFMDDAIAAQYQSDGQWAQIVTAAAGFALFIAVLGLLGLALLAAQQRTREVSIRKVLGASDASVIALVARRFVALVAAAVMLGAPAAYVGVQQWLQAFAYRVDVGWLPFVGAAALVLLVALATVAAQVWRVTRVDPAQVLRTE